MMLECDRSGRREGGTMEGRNGDEMDVGRREGKEGPFGSCEWE